MSSEHAGRRSDTSEPIRALASAPLPESSESPGPDIEDVELLLPLALSQPPLAVSRARAVLAARPDARSASVAHQAIGIVERDAGRHDVALAEVTIALRLARRAGDDRVADVLATLGLTLGYAGRTVTGLRRLDEARTLTPAAGLPRLLLRRAHLLHLVGRDTEALADLRVAIRGSRRDGDILWEARGLNNRSLVHLALGRTSLAEDDARQAGALFDALGQRLESAHALHNRGIAAHQRGDLPEALDLLHAVTGRYAQIGVLPPDLVIDHGNALLTAGLATEARARVEAALGSDDITSLKRAEMHLLAARAALASADVDAAGRHADQARRAFTRQHRPGWAQLAELLALQADTDRALAEPGVRTATPTPATLGRLLRRAEALSTALARDRAPESVQALLLHGRLALRVGRLSEATASLRAAARARHTGPPLTRAVAWLAAALVARERRDRRGILLASRRGLDAVDEHRDSIGDLELRALASAHGLELAGVAVTENLRRGSARDVLWWVERWRAAALESIVPRPHHDALDCDVAALRDVTRRLGVADDQQPSRALVRERARLEASVRRRYRQLRGAGTAGTSIDLAALLAGLGDTVLLTLLTIDGRLYAVTAAAGRVTRRELGSLARAQSEAAFAGFTLRRAAHGRRVPLASSAERLQDAILGSPSAAWSAPRVVIVPPASLLSIPWGLLPVFAKTSLTVAPSLTMWARAAARPAPPDGRVALVTGPDLTTDQEEVTRVGDLYPRATVLGGAEATVERALGALDGVALAHVAAHGTFRSDAPLFSSLLLADGPLMVHDLDRLERPPHTMVLSACDSGGLAPIAADEALGLVASLLAMGTSTVLASVAPVNDRATVTVMRQVHTTIAAGGTVADGLRDARRASRADAVVAATAGAFTAWGA